MKEDSIVFDSKHIVIEELPVGCVIYDKYRKESVVIGASKDIDAVIESLERLKEAWYSGEGDELEL